MFQSTGELMACRKENRSCVKVCEIILRGNKLTLCWYTFITTTRNITVLHGLLQIIKLTNRISIKSKTILE
jgi:hypothetical protein